MNIFIDCEWNGPGGELISMALVSEDGKEFYEVLDCLEPVDWVAANVIPKLDKNPVSRKVFTESLGFYLNHFELLHIISDWPEDISYFCKALIVSPGQKLWTPQVSMQIRSIESKSEVPHNALWDARGIRDEFCK